jgi:hypothetical protein
MNRLLQIVAGPEVVLGVLSVFVFIFCARHGSYSSADVRLLERLIWLLPLLVVPLAFATILLPGSKNWWWLGRVNLAVLVCLLVCAVRIVQGFGAPGSGPKGQDAGLIVVVSLGVVFGAIANAVAGAFILREQNSSFDEWFRMRPVIASVLTALASVPVMIAQTAATGLLLGVGLAIVAAFKR